MAKKQGGDMKKYRNEGASQLVIEGEEINPGTEFMASLSPEFEEQMFAGGHLSLVSDQSSAADEAQAASEGEVISEDAPRRRRSNS